jgi:hypothetical protein
MPCHVMCHDQVQERVVDIVKDMGQAQKDKEAKGAAAAAAAVSLASLSREGMGDAKEVS